MFLIEPPLFPSRPVDPTFPWQSGPALKTSERAPNAPDTLAPRTPCRMAGCQHWLDTMGTPWCTWTYLAHGGTHDPSWLSKIKR